MSEGSIKYRATSPLASSDRVLPAPCWPPRDRLPILYCVGDLLLESDAAECVAFDRVFPIFADESVFLSETIEPGDGLLLDIGTGSGVQALTAAARGWTTVGTDVNPLALACARYNAARNGLLSKASWQECSVFEGLPEGRFDRIVANPPFLPSPSAAHIPVSSDGGSDGLRVVGPLVRQARRYLTPGGTLTLLAVCCGSSRRTLVEEILRDSFDASTDSIEVTDVYGEALPLDELVECFRGLDGIEEWTGSICGAGFSELRYLLFSVRRDGVAARPSLPSLECGEYSGSWRGRLNRYRAWAKALTGTADVPLCYQQSAKCLEPSRSGGG